MLKYLIKLIYLCGYLLGYLRTLFQAPKRGIRPLCGQCPIMVYHLLCYLWVHLMVHLKIYFLMVYLWGYLCGYFLLGLYVYIFKTYFKKFSYNKDIKMDILYQKYIQN